MFEEQEFRRYPKVLPERSKTAQPSSTVRGGTTHDPYLAASYARTEWVVADTDLLVDDVVRKVVLSTGHRPDEHSDVMCFGYRR
jgi:hypothetical protein